jgi:GNAT superfamily N-acetyltransferase
MNIELSPIDEARFGVVTAKTVIENEFNPNALDAWCATNKVAMLIARCPTTATDLVQMLEEGGARLMDTLVYFAVHTPDPVTAFIPDGYQWRLANAADSDAVGRLAARAFTGFAGHYHADPRLPAASSDQVYTSWAERSCADARVAQAVLLITHDEQIVGFLTLKKLPSGEAEIALNAVAPGHQGRGLYAALVALARDWSAREGCTDLLVSTQISNIAPQKTWCRQGFEPRNSYYTFHKWYTQ